MTTQKPTFDIDTALKGLREGKGLTGKDGVLTPLIKQLTEAAMLAELESHLEQDETPNRKNGCTGKTVKSPVGAFELNTPRDRAGTFEPQLVKKHQTHLTEELERKIIALFSLGMSYQDIRSNIKDLYGISVSNGTLNTMEKGTLPFSKEILPGSIKFMLIFSDAKEGSHSVSKYPPSRYPAG